MKRLLFLAPIILLADNQIVNKIEFIGLKHLSPITAKEISLIQSGDSLNLEKVDKTIKKFYSYNYFKQIKAEYKDGVLIYKFTEKPAILKIEYKNVSTDLKEILKDKIKKGMIFSEQKLEEIKNFIVNYYDAKGEFNTIVVFDKKRVGNGIILTININKGESIVIDKLKFYGVKKEKVSDIKEELINKDRDPMWWLPFMNSGEFHIQGLLTDSQSIKNYYLSKGYLDVEVSQPFFVANFDSNKGELEYKVKEGVRYRVGKVSISVEDNQEVKLDNYYSDLHLIGGFYFNVNRLRKDISLLKRAVADLGYAYVKVYPDIKKRDNNVVDVTYKIVTGKKVYISDVEIEGNSKTLDRVIRRNIYLAPNYLYSLTDKEDTINSLKRTGYFDDVQLEEIPIDDTHMKILVKVKEGLTGSLRAGISWNSYSKFGFNVNVSEKNIFGSGQSLSLDFEKSSATTKYSATLKNPRVLDSNYFLSTSIYNNDFEGYSYDSNRQGISFTTGRKITRHSSASITYGYEHLKLSNIEDDTVDYYKENSIKSYIQPSIGFNNTDDYWFPQNGVSLSASLQYAGLGGDQKFTKENGLAKFFYSLENKFDITTILKYKFKIGFIQDRGYLPINEKYYLGGLGTVRGYDYGSISPKDKTGDSIGGKQMMLNSVELSLPVSIKKKMWLSLFVDNGRVGENSMNIVRNSYGVSFDWITPIGPLNFTWAWPIGEKEGDDTRKFEFSIGSGF